MKAMILAAGLGTRLRPLTNDRPKALVVVAGRTLLEIALSRLHSFGIRQVIVNVHHFADMVVEYLKVNGNFGMHIEISREDVLLDTGGGLKKAAWFLADEPFIMHNVDVISTIDLHRMVDAHNGNQAIATLAVQDRQTARPLLFDERLRLCGRVRDQKTEIVRPSLETRALAFSGIHVISPEIFSMMTETGAFSIIPAYLNLVSRGAAIAGFRADEYYWKDLGRPDDLMQAAQDLQDRATE